METLFCLMSSNHSVQQTMILLTVKVPVAANKKEGFFLQNIVKVNSIHTILKYGDYHDFLVRKWCSS